MVDASPHRAEAAAAASMRAALCSVTLLPELTQARLELLTLLAATALCIQPSTSKHLPDIPFITPVVDINFGFASGTVLQVISLTNSRGEPLPWSWVVVRWAYGSDYKNQRHAGKSRVADSAPLWRAVAVRKDRGSIPRQTIFFFFSGRF